MASRTTDRHLVVVFGATGDLVRKKLAPALYRLTERLGGDEPVFHVLGLARRPLTENEFRETSARALVEDGVAKARAARRWANRTLSYSALPDEGASGYEPLRSRCESLERECGLPGNRILYLALPAEAFAPTIQRIGDAGLNRSPGWTRLVVEKPFGTDLDSARALNALIHRYFPERSVFRIDHYLGKETTQNLIVFRFANMLFESVWNRDRIDHVEITVAEKIGIDERAGYFDRVGQLRDMVQSHLAQLLTLIAMEVPSSLDADQIRNEKVKVLRSLEPIRAEDVVLGQYRAGVVDRRRVRGYRAEEGVRPRSRTETFAALRVLINNWRWHGIPFFLRTGKRLPQKRTQIVVRFRSPPVWFFPENGHAEITANSLTITIQPDEGFELGIEIKQPGEEVRLQTERLHFRYAEAFGPLADAYETLVHEVMLGDATLFVRADEVEASWEAIGPLLTRPPRLSFYPAGTWGPPAARELIGREGHAWSSD